MVNKNDLHGPLSMQNQFDHIKLSNLTQLHTKSRLQSDTQ